MHFAIFLFPYALWLTKPQCETLLHFCFALDPFATWPPWSQRNKKKKWEASAVMQRLKKVSSAEPRWALRCLRRQPGPLTDSRLSATSLFNDPHKVEQNYVHIQNLPLACLLLTRQNRRLLSPLPSLKQVPNSHTLRPQTERNKFKLIFSCPEYHSAICRFECSAIADMYPTGRLNPKHEDSCLGVKNTPHTPWVQRKVSGKRVPCSPRYF